MLMVLTIWLRSLAMRKEQSPQYTKVMGNGWSVVGAEAG